jgi:RHS repeat-associated protein
MTYDALNRIESLLYPEDVTGNRKTCTPLYNRAGALEQVVIDGTSYLSRIAYDAKGQRSLIAYGNGLMTRYAYDPQTFRLIRLRTEGYAIPAAFTYQPIGTVFQDYAYTYDLVGNLLGLSDRTPGCGVPGTVLGTGALNRTFTYDPIYRLLSANGRECAASPASPWDDSPRCTDLTLAQNYAENYVYDPGGNISQLQHQAANGAFNRLFAFSNPSDLPVPIDNRLATMTIGQTISKYLYDDGGNLVQENTSRHFEWDHSDRMRAYRTQPGNAEPSVYAQYLYDSAGQRTKKLVRKQGGKVEVTVYVDGLFEYQSITNAGSVQKNNTLHVMDNQSRIALLRVGNPFSGDSTPAVQYQFGDHLGSSNVVVDGTGALVNREEYTPYGETSFGSFALKRYRFTGKERDEESGLAYHGARYYAPWLARWSSADPAGIVDGLNLYCYVRSNPLALVDGHGTDGTPPTPKENPSNTPPPIKQDEIPAGAADTPTGGKIIEYDSSKINEETQKSIENVQEYLGKTAEYAAQATAEGVVAAEKGAYNAVVDTAKAVVSGDPRLKRGPYAQAQLEMVLRPLDAIRATPPEGAGYLPYLGGYVLGILAPSGLAGNAEPAALEAGYVGGRNTGTGTLSFRGQQIPVRRINCAFCSIAGADAIPSTTSTSAANFEGLTEGPVKDAAAVGSLLAGRGLGSGTPDVVGSPADAHNFMTGFPEGTKFVLVYTQTAVSHAINARVGSFGLYYTDNQAFLGGLRVSFSLPSAAQVVHVFTAYNPWW